jgi:hypothetical protein
MEATMEGSGTAGMPAAEVPQVKAGAATQAVLDALHQAWWFTLGLVVVAGEGTAKLAKAAVERGKSVEPTLKVPFQKTDLSGALSGAGSRLKGVGSSLLRRGAGAAEGTLTEVQNLKAKVEDLASKVEELQAKHEKPEQEKPEREKPVKRTH